MWQDEILSQCFMGLQNWRYIWEDEKMLLCRFDMKRQKCLITLKAKIRIWQCVLCAETIRWKKHVLSCPSTIVNLFFTQLIDLSLYRKPFETHFPSKLNPHTCTHLLSRQIFELIFQSFLNFTLRRKKDDNIFNAL